MRAFDSLGGGWRDLGEESFITSFLLPLSALYIPPSLIHILYSITELIELACVVLPRAQILIV